MIIYFLLVVIVTTLLIKSNRNQYPKEFKGFFIFLSALILIIFAGFRSNEIGVDTNNYISFFNKFDVNQSIFDIDSKRAIGFQILMYISKSISQSYWSLLLSIAIICVFLTYRTLKKLSSYLTVSVFLYMTLAFYLFFFNGAKQGLAASIYGIALVNLVNKNFLKYLFYVFLASLFHKTVIIMLPFYFILQLRFSIKKMIVFSVLSFVSIYFIGTILSVFNDDFQNRYGEYLDRGKSGGVLLGLFFTLNALLFVFMRKYISKAKLRVYDIYLFLTVFLALIYLVVISTGLDVNLIRLTLYFSFGHLLIWPIVLKDVPIFKLSIAKRLFYLVHLFFFFIYLTTMRKYTPYQFNDLFSNIF